MAKSISCENLKKKAKVQYRHIKYQDSLRSQLGWGLLTVYMLLTVAGLGFNAIILGIGIRHWTVEPGDFTRCSVPLPTFLIVFSAFNLGCAFCKIFCPLRTILWQTLGNLILGFFGLVLLAVALSKPQVEDPRSRDYCHHEAVYSAVTLDIFALFQCALEVAIFIGLYIKHERNRRRDKWLGSQRRMLDQDLELGLIDLGDDEEESESQSDEIVLMVDADGNGYEADISSSEASQSDTSYHTLDCSR